MTWPRVPCARLGGGGGCGFLALASARGPCDLASRPGRKERRLSRHRLGRTPVVRRDWPTTTRSPTTDRLKPPSLVSRPGAGGSPVCSPVSQQSAPRLADLLSPRAVLLGRCCNV